MNGGFTLIELIAVIVIVSILAAVAAPSLANLGASRASAAAKQLLSDVTYARQRAIATGTPTWVVFNTGAETWSILEEDPNAPGRAGATTLNDPANGKPFTITLNSDPYIGVELVAAAFDGNPEIGFDWLGRPLNTTGSALAANGSVTITGNRVMTVYIGTGQIHLVNPGGS